MKIPILMYHRVSVAAPPSRYTVAAREFERQMMALHNGGYQVVSLSDALALFQMPQQDSLKLVCITFDDGFKETWEFAAPILRRLGFTATFFLVSGLMGENNRWDRSHPEVGEGALMNWDEAKELLAAGFDVGSHSVTHAALTELATAEAADEIYRSKQDLEAKLSVAIRHFAYPYGRFSECIRDMVRSAGYQTGCSTLSGFATGESDRWALRRIEVVGRDSRRMFQRKVVFGASEMGVGAVLRYYTRRGVTHLVGPSG